MFSIFTDPIRNLMAATCAISNYPCIGMLADGWQEAKLSHFFGGFNVLNLIAKATLWKKKFEPCAYLNV